MSARGPRLRVVCVSDIYTLEPLPRLRSLVARERRDDPADALLVVLAGDFLSPNMLTSLDGGVGMVDCMNAVPFTHVALGNHEDDLETTALSARLRELDATCLCANVDGLELTPSAVVTLPGRGRDVLRVGLVGSVMEDRSVYPRVPFGGLPLRPANGATVAEVERLRREEGCDAVLVLTHQPIADDRALARALEGLGVPLLVGGHEHEPATEATHGLILIKAGRDALTPRIVDLEWPAEAAEGAGLVRPEVRVRTVELHDVPEDAELAARVARHRRKLEVLERATLRRLAPGETLSSVGARRQPTSVGTMLTSLLRERFGAEGALLNGGAIRAGREYRERFTYADLRAEVPFDNDVVVVELLGAVLADALKYSRRAAPRESGSYLHVDDAMVVDEANELLAIAGEPLEPARRYRIATVRNFFLGLDHIEPLVRFASEHPEAVPPDDAGREVKLVLVEGFMLELFGRLGPFAALDADGSGGLDSGELAVALERLTEEPASPLTVELMLRSLDHDRDGVVSHEEATHAGKR
ncbi:MAG: 5'-nucleotidase C-terminal domain-containing protein [Deltaproteobacteria bacterium]|nr:5'-nucleotidase C-terminal domain-containing protein [Deltaproteobacteria bacterium]